MDKANYNIASKQDKDSCLQSIAEHESKTLVDNNRNLLIQILRVSACMLVFLVHFGQRVELSGFLRNFTNFGALGVQIFFLISGYLVGKTFFNCENVDIKKYYLKRAIAILPLYYLVILYFFITENILNQFVSVIPPDELSLGWLRYVFLLNGFIEGRSYFWHNLGATWTIPVFCFFYLIAPWILRKTKTVFSVCLVWGIVFAVTQLISSVYAAPIFSNLHYLFLGVVLYVCVVKNKAKYAELVFLIVLICKFIWSIDISVYDIIFPMIILVFTTIDNITLPTKMQSILNILDKYSYTVYLMHAVVFCSLLDRLKALEVSSVIIGILAFVGTFIATFVVGKFIEKPLQDYLKKKILK